MCMPPHIHKGMQEPLEMAANYAIISLKSNTTYEIEQKLRWISVFIVTDADQRHTFTDVLKTYHRALKNIKLGSLLRMKMYNFIYS